jgi:hypothetical protein
LIFKNFCFLNSVKTRIGVIGELTAPVVVAADGEIAGLVMKVEVITAEPVPAAFIADTADVY